MANDFFGRKDSIWGGETLKCAENKPRLGVKVGDLFRVEKGPKSKFTLIPHPHNQGSWKESHNKSNPVNIRPTKHTPTDFARAYSMMVTIKRGQPPTKLFLVELESGGIAIALKAADPGGGGNDDEMASVER